MGKKIYIRIFYHNVEKKSIIEKKEQKKKASFRDALIIKRQQSIFPGGHPPSILGANELNYRVRNGNGWDLAAISTAYEVFEENIFWTLSKLNNEHILGSIN